MVAICHDSPNRRDSHVLRLQVTVSRDTATRPHHSGPYSGGRGSAAHVLPRPPARHPFHFLCTYLVTTLTFNNKPVSVVPKAKGRHSGRFLQTQCQRGPEQTFLVCVVPCVGSLASLCTRLGRTLEIMDAFWIRSHCSGTFSSPAEQLSHKWKTRPASFQKSPEGRGLTVFWFPLV